VLKGAERVASGLHPQLLDRRAAQRLHPGEHLLPERVEGVAGHLHRRRKQVAFLLDGVRVQGGDERLPFALVLSRRRRGAQAVFGKRDGD